MFSYLDMIRSNKSVYVPDQKIGTWLVQLAISLSRALGVRGIKLIDRSKIVIDKSEYNLLFLRIFAGKYSSWYHKFGFRLANDKMLVADMNSLYHLHPAIFPSANDLTSHDIHLGPYMTKLWNINKALYAKIFDEVKGNPLYNKIQSIAREEYTLLFR